MDGSSTKGKCFSYPKETWEGKSPQNTMTFKDSTMKVTAPHSPGKFVLPEYCNDLFTKSGLKSSVQYLSNEAEPYQKSDFYSIVKAINQFKKTTPEPKTLAGPPMPRNLAILPEGRSPSKVVKVETAPPKSSQQTASLPERDDGDVRGYADKYLNETTMRYVSVWLRTVTQQQKNLFRAVFRRIWVWESDLPPSETPPPTPEGNKPRYIN